MSRASPFPTDETLGQALRVGITTVERGDFLSARPVEEVVIPANETYVDVLLATVDDTVAEDDGVITVSLDEPRVAAGAAPGYSYEIDSAFGEVRLVVLDDEPKQTVSVTAERASVSEGVRAAFVVTRAGTEASGDLSVRFRVTMTGTPHAAGAFTYSAYTVASFRPA